MKYLKEHSLFKDLVSTKIALGQFTDKYKTNKELTGSNEGG